MSKKCQFSNRKANNAYAVSHSRTRTKKIQNVNLHKKRIWSTRQLRWIKVHISAKSMKNRHLINI